MEEAVIHQGFSFPVMYLLSPPGENLCTKSWDSLGRGFPPLPTQTPTKKIRMIMNTKNVMGGGNGSVASRRGRGEEDPPYPLLLWWRALT